MIKSVGTLLKNARQKKNFTIEDIHKQVKIHPTYLKALEADDYSVFDGKIHAKGFLKIYAGYLELKLDEVMALWRREYESVFDAKIPDKMPRIKTLEPERFVVTPSVLILSAVIIFLSGFFFYLFFQYHQYTDAPNLEIFFPSDNHVTEQDVLDITGKVELDSEVFINGQKIISNTDGGFLTSLKLREGINNVSIEAVNKLGKKTEKIRTVIFRPQKYESPPLPEDDEVVEDIVLQENVD